MMGKVHINEWIHNWTFDDSMGKESSMTSTVIYYILKGGKSPSVTTEEHQHQQPGKSCLY